MSFGDWKLIDLQLQPRPAARFIIPPAGQTWMIEGTVAEIGIVPRPGNVAYADHILAIHLKDVSGPSLSDSHSQAVVYLRSMRNNQLTDAAASHIGQRISLKIRDWSEVSRQYELIRRSDLDASLRSHPACWGELAP